jgi:hypothetical protein
MNNEVISKFKEKPKTKIAWWAMGLGLSTILVLPLSILLSVIIRLIISKISGENVGVPMGFNSGIISLIVSIFALIAGIRAFKKGERSWILWLGFIPAILASAFWVFMIIGEFLFPH